MVEGFGVFEVLLGRIRRILIVTYRGSVYVWSKLSIPEADGCAGIPVKILDTLNIAKEDWEYFEYDW